MSPVAGEPYVLTPAHSAPPVTTGWQAPPEPIEIGHLGDLDDVDTSGEAAGDVLEFDGSQWRPETPNRSPLGGAGGVLSGSYPNPGFAVNMATQAELDVQTGRINAIPGAAYTHTQDASALVVQVPHNLHMRPAAVTCIDALGTPTEYSSVSWPSLDLVEVHFDRAFTGSIYLS